jgi:D-3-phosphoglycerate dehydrogenase / 2-oxoglutarate reductase
MRLLVADKMQVQPLTDLQVLGLEISYQPDLRPEELLGALKDAAVLVVGSKRVPAEVIEKAPKLALVVRAGAALGTIDVAAASRRGVYVANCPGKNAEAVAELTMGMMLALDRRIVDATLSLRDGRWARSEFLGARGLYGRRLGLAGFGSIGRLVAKHARAFGMEVNVWSRSLTAPKAQKLGLGFCPTLLSLAHESDVLTIHLPLNGDTRGAVDREVLSALPRGGIFINTARSEVVDEIALADVAAERGLRVGLDVFSDEPRAGGAFKPSVLQRLEAAGALVYATPRIGASTEQAQIATSHEVARIVRAFLTEEEVPNVVNVCKNTPARFALVVRSRDEVGVLANVLNVIKRHGLNVEEVANTVFDGAKAACTKLRLSGRPGDDCLREILAFDEVFHVDVVALPNLA